MKNNLDKLPDMVTLAAQLGIEEVKGVYLTAFSKDFETETLFDVPEKIREIFNIAKDRADRYNIILSLPQIPGEDSAGDALHGKCHLAWRDLFIGCDGVVRPCMASENTLMKLPAPGSDLKKDLWNTPELIDFRKRVNGSADEMNPACSKCFQSSSANWNKRHSFIQTDNRFHPEWGNPDA
jgi:MoaA/NifB/PqqE/SkfB family radical SAM enzyme